jgi:glycine cleavage system H protein
LPISTDDRLADGSVVVHAGTSDMGQGARTILAQIAADELTDITFLQLPKVGQTVTADQAFGEIESVKATADLMSGVSGVVVEANAALNDNPGLVNQDPYAGGWMIKVKLADPASVEKLLSAEDYLKKTGH